MKPVLYLVIPCYNEEQVLSITGRLFAEQLEKMIRGGKIKDESRILFVDDGSTDATWKIICRWMSETKYCQGMRLKKNSGQQKALMTGLMAVKEKCDIAVTMDCDGQDDVEVMEQMVDAYLQGAHVVCGVREDRKSDAGLKRFTAQWYYSLLKCIDKDTIADHGDYRLVSREALDCLVSIETDDLYLRGMFSSMDLPRAVVYYKRKKRMAGKGHYTVRKMLGLAWNGFSFAFRKISER